MKYIINLFVIFTLFSCVSKKQIDTCTMCCGIDGEVNQYTIEHQDIKSIMGTLSGRAYGKVKSADSVMVYELGYASIAYKTKKDTVFSEEMMADEDGRFSLHLPKGKYDIRFSYVAFNHLEVKQVEVKKRCNTTLDVTLGFGGPDNTTVYHIGRRKKTIKEH